MKPLPVEFLAGDAPAVAPQLLGKLWLVGGQLARLTEVEAYTADDPASHSYRGPTPRTRTMFGPPGHLYVYLVYGIHHCANIVTGSEGDGQAVLIRAVEIEGVDSRTTTGPGRVCKALGIDRSCDGSAVALFDDGTPPPSRPTVTARIGLTKATDWPRRWVTPGRRQI